MFSIRLLPPDERYPGRLSVGFKGSTAGSGPASTVRISRGERRLVRLTEGEGVALKASGGLLRGVAVISPLCVLERSRKTPFKIKDRRGRSRRPADPFNIVCTVVRTGRRRFFYLPVEGMDDGSFYARFKAIAGRGTVRLVIVDGAERLSPRCDRFDPLSDGLARFVAALGTDTPNVAVLAVTDRSEAAVQRDIRTRLDLKGEAPGPAVHLTPEMRSFQVIRAYGRSQKEAAYTRVLRRDIPAAVGAPVASGTVLAPGPRGGPGGLKIRLRGSDPGGTTVGRHTRPLSAPSYRPGYCHPHHRPAHDLEAPFPETRHHRHHDLLVLSGGGGETDKGRFILDITLDGGLERWRRHVFPGEDRHCIHLADLPSDLCEADMIARGDPVPRCSAEGCPFGKKEICDYGRRHLVIQQVRPDPVAETLKSLKMLDRLLETAARGGEIVRLAPGRDAGEAARALDRLKAIGVVADFRLSEGDGFEVKGFRPSVRMSQMVGVAETCRNRLDLPPEGRPADSPADRAARIRKKYRPFIEAPLKVAMAGGEICRHLKDARLFEAAADVLLSILAPFARAMEEMAYRSLWNLTAFLLDEGCRQAALIRHYQPVPSQWRCGRCDRCDPTMTFKPEADPEPGLSEEDRLAARRLTDWLAGDAGEVDTGRAAEIRNGFSDDPEHPYRRAAAFLEGDPRNLRALWLARQCAPQREINMANVFLMRVACEQLAFPQVRRFYEEAAESAKPALVEILDDEFGPANCPEGERLLYREAKRLSASRDRVARLRARCAVESLRDLDLTAWKAKLHACLEEFH